MPESPKVSCLGPAGTFSHQAVGVHFAGGIPSFSDSLEEVMESVVHQDCEFGVAPFDNSNSTGVVRVQLALIAHRRQLYVSSLHPLHIRLNLYCWGEKAEEIREIRSIEVVFKQAEEWIKANTPGAKRVKTSSTASAVLSLVETGATEIAAI